jgi:hypothetical protein
MSCASYNPVARVVFGILLHVQDPVIPRKGVSPVCTVLVVPFLQTVVYRTYAKYNTKLNLIYYTRTYVKFLPDTRNIFQIAKHFVHSVIKYTVLPNI